MLFTNQDYLIIIWSGQWDLRLLLSATKDTYFLVCYRRMNILIYNVLLFKTFHSFTDTGEDYVISAIPDLL